ncbi:MAG: hypothetical protein V9G42_04020 [Bacteroidia bacterium]
METTLKGHFLNLYHMALSDTEVDTTELEILYKIGEEKGISKLEIDEVVVRPDTIKFSPPESVLEKIESLYDFARIAWADGKIDENEKRVMTMFCRKFGFEKDNIPSIVEFLLDEVQKGTSKEEIFKIVSENL